MPMPLLQQAATVSGHIMRAFLFIALILQFKFSYGQKKECGCKSDSLINQYTTNCSTTHLKNGSKIYWQFNCNSIWLTLENKSGKRITLDKVPIEYYSYTYRLGYHLAKEYKKALLFKSGCPANGPCDFVLIDKTSGKKISEFGELIYDHTTNKFYDFVIYFSSPSSLVLHYIDTNKKYKFVVEPDNFNAVVPEYTFNEIYIKNNILTLTYDPVKVRSSGIIKINLNKYVR